MSDTKRPFGYGETQLRRRISATDTTIPILSASPLRVDADIHMGGEIIRCESIGEDEFGEPALLECQRGTRQEDGGSPASEWFGGTPLYQLGWSTMEIVDDIPTPTPAMVGRQFLHRDSEGRINTYNVINSPEGSPVINWVNEPDDDEEAMRFSWASLITGLSNISGVALDSSSNIYVAYNGANIRKYNSLLTPQWTQTIVETPRKLAVDGTSVFASDDWDHQILKRTAALGTAGTPAKWGSYGITTGQFKHPMGLATDGVHVWVADYNNDRIQKFTVAGVYVSHVACIDVRDVTLSGGVLYALSSFSVYKYNPDTLAIIASLPHTNGIADGQIDKYAEGIAIDSTGRIWIADTGNHRIQVFSSTGEFLGKFGSYGTGIGKFKSPKGISFDPTGTLLHIVDYGNNRLVTLKQVFTTPFNPVIVSPLVGQFLRFNGTEWVNVVLDDYLPSPILSLSLTLLNDAITLPEIPGYVSIIRIRVDTQGGAAADNLATINITGTVAIGTEISLRTDANARDVTVNELGNIDLNAATIVLDNTADRLMLERSETGWVQVAPLSNNV